MVTTAQEKARRKHEVRDKELGKDTNVPAFFGSHAYDQAVAGIGAGAVATMCMNPLDLIKVKFQVDRSPVRPLFSGGLGASSNWSTWTGGRVGRDMMQSLRAIVRDQGVAGLYRGVCTNIVGNSLSWGLYFLWYTQMKDLIAHGDETLRLSPGQHLLAASVSGCASAWLTNPIWVVKVRMFSHAPVRTARAGAGGTGGAASAHEMRIYTGLWDGLRSIYRTEGVRGWYRGAGLSLLGVSNGAIQFTVYESLKRWRSGVAMRRAGGDAGSVPEGGVKLSNMEYILCSGGSKTLAICATYPYQVVRSRVQNYSAASRTTGAPKSSASNAEFPTALATIRSTFAREGGIRAFYKGLTATFIRVLPSTCVTFVVYEQIAWFLRDAAASRVGRQQLKDSS